MWVAFIIWVFGRIDVPPGVADEDEVIACDTIRIYIPNG